MAGLISYLRLRIVLVMLVAYGLYTASTVSGLPVNRLDIIGVKEAIPDKAESQRLGLLPRLGLL